MLFGVREGDGSTLGSAVRGTTFVVAAQPQFEVVGRTNVERTVGTAEHVDVEDRCLGALRLACTHALAQGTIRLGRGMVIVGALRLTCSQALAQGTMSEGAKRPSRMVEAAGVEPASESASPKASTCVSTLEGSRPA